MTVFMHLYTAPCNYKDWIIPKDMDFGVSFKHTLTLHAHAHTTCKCNQCFIIDIKDTIPNDAQALTKKLPIKTEHTPL